MLEDIQSPIAWQTVNDVSKRKCTSRGLLKATSQEERIHLWNEHLKNSLGKSSKVTDEPITQSIDNRLDIKLVYARRTRFKQKVKRGKMPVSIKYLPKYGEQGYSTTYYSDTPTPYITRTQQTDEQRAASSRSARKATWELPGTTRV